MLKLSGSNLIGESDEFKQILKQVRIVGPTDCGVLIQGETGTGKELIAQAIHDQSSRAGGPFVKLNCAAIPTALLESELFGHERGAFTGALTQRLGRLQVANKGTLLLDEIGDLPLEVQPKLLRALQEREFERLGSSQTIRVNVRIIAATNQNLEQMVNDRQFRADLYYRLNVFPIALPPLRDRQKDIALLVRHFVQEYANRLNKPIPGIPDHVMNALCRYAWPGNIRELQNVIERAVLLAQGSDLEFSPLGVINAAPVRPTHPDHTLAEMERSYIADTLRKTNWVVGGRAGAAARLGLPRTTLISRMRKLGISREDVWPRAAEFGDSLDDAVPTATPWMHSRRLRIVG
ncbi:MAG: Fis family transcriptional regulator [Terriglobia bacterium]|nr:MAG: Fis family transcriptional regulator [Terriglobia bacterium]